MHLFSTIQGIGSCHNVVEDSNPKSTNWYNLQEQGIHLDINKHVEKENNVDYNSHIT